MKKFVQRFIALTMALAVICIGGQYLYGAQGALSADRAVEATGTSSVAYSMAAVHIYNGALVCVTSATGYATNCSATAGIVVVGVALENIDNSAGNAGDKTIRVAADKIFKFYNDSSHPVVITGVGGLAYIADNQTVGTSAESNSIVAGIVQRFTSTYVWVYIPSPAWQVSLASVYGVGSFSNRYSGALAVGTTVTTTMVAPKAGSIIGAYLYCPIVQTAAGSTTNTKLQAEVLVGSTTIFTTKPQITKAASNGASTYATATGVTAGVLSSTAVAFTAGQKIYVEYIQGGTTCTVYPTNCTISVWYKTLVQ